MIPRARFGIAPFLPLLLAVPAVADEELETRWSATLMGEFHAIDSVDDDDEVTGFFDRYEFTPNKSSALPFELGIREGAFDLFGTNQTPKLQLRLASPTSNLGVTGAEIDQPFLNQRIDLLGRLDALRFDIDYRRLRTEDLRLFPDPTGSGLTFSDLTNRGDRFSLDRTGFYGELRLRPDALLEDPPEILGWLAPELALRGGYQGRDGERQFRFLMDPSNDWISRTQDLEAGVGEVGGGLRVGPGGLFTMIFDFDHERFRHNSRAFLESDLGGGFPPSSRTLGFIPDTDRSTGTVQLHGRLGQRAELEGGFQISRLKQVGDQTPAQTTWGLTDNELLFYSANVAADLSIAGGVTANAFFKFDQRDNDIQRNTGLFGPTKQIGPFLERLRRIVAGVETVVPLGRTNQLALGGRLEWIDRELDFVPSGLGIPRILFENSLVAEKTKMYTAYGRVNLRPVPGMTVRGEVGYRSAPDTGYITDLDDYVYGKLRTSVALSLGRLGRPFLLSALIEGDSGRNRDFSMVGGVGPSPAGATVDRDFDRSRYLWALTATASPRKNLALFTSISRSRDVRDYDLTLSDDPRYAQDLLSLVFTADGPVEHRSTDWNWVLGTQAQLAERTDAGLSYSFSRVKSDYRSSAPSTNISRIQSSSSIDADIHGLDLRIGHWLKDGLRVLVGYRFQHYRDEAPVPTGSGSVVGPVDRSANRHTVTIGVTLTSDLLRKDG